MLAIVFSIVSSQAAEAQSVTASPTSVSFGNQAEGTTSPAKKVTLKNGQTSPITISGISTTLSDYAESNNCPVSPATLAAGASCSISVTFTPSALGTRSANLTIVDTGTSSPQVVALSGNGTAPTLVSIAVTPASPSVAAGNSQQFAATGTYSNGSTQNLTSTAEWNSSATTIAKISATGLATTLAPGTTTITAKSGAITGSATLTVTAAVLTSLSVTPASASVAAGNTQQFTATGTYSNGSTQNLSSTVKWTSSAATVATVNGSGLATGVAPGTAPITATSGSINSSATLTVTAPVLTAISVTPATPSVAAGNTQQFTATGTYSNGSTQNLTGTAKWTSSTTTIATVSSAGLATAVAPGTTTITAKSGSIAGSATLTVTAAVLTSLSVTPASASVAAGYTQQFTATGTYSNGSTQNLTSSVKWTSSATGIATINSGGLAASVAPGTATITATSGSISGSATLTVNAAVLTAISVTPATPSVAAGNTQQFAATGTYSNGSTQNLTSSAKWTSSSTTTAKISASGLATTLVQGATTITAKSGAITGSATLTVTAAVLTSLSVTPASASVPAGNTEQFTATGTYSDGSTQNLTSTVQWSSSATGIATINSGGLATSVAQGSATITASSGAISGFATLKVKAAVLTSISVTPSVASVAAGTSQQFAATGTYSNGSTQNLTTTVLWSSSATSVATINTGGLANAAAQGGTMITATSGAISGSAALTVTPPVLTSLAVTPATASISKGTSQQFTATGTYSDGSTQNLTSSVSWSSSSGVATISATGLATGEGVGAATITATWGAITATATLSVGQPVLVSLAVTPANPSFALGTTQALFATGIYSDGSTLDLTSQANWSTGDGGIATISAPGVATSVAVGSTSVSATVGAISGSTTITVSPAVLVSIAVTPAIPTIPLGTTQPFTATGTYTDGSTQNITGTVQWSSDTLTVATISNAAGTQGNASGVGQGSATITASVGAVMGSTTLVVSSAALVSIAVTPATPTLALGTTQQFAATGTFTDGGTQDLTSTVTWTSDTPAAATINAAGLAQSTGLGTATITATTTAASGTVSSSTVLTVTAAALVSIAITPPAATIPLGVTQQFTALGTFTDGSTQDVTQSGHWSSTVAAVATISDTAGTAGLASTLGTGVTTIGISSNGVSAAAALTVSPAALAAIAITPQTPSIALGTSQQFTAMGTYTDGSTQDVTAVVSWSSSDATVAIIGNTVGSYGLATSSGQGSATITATATTSSVFSSTTITVGQANVISIAVTPSSISILLGAAEQFTATATYSDGSIQDITQFATWMSSNPSVATVSSTGLAMSMLAGTTSISASSGSATGASVLMVNPPVPVSLQIGPANPTVSAGAQLQFDATLFYSDGSSVNVNSMVGWTSSNPTVATIGSTGLAESLTAGTSTIEANWGANLLTSTVSLTVDAPNTFFVATNGSDSWSGKLASPNSNNSDGPFASLSRAQYAVEPAPKPATVMVRNGTYYLALTPSTANSYPGGLTFTSADSGSSISSQVTWQNYPGETPVVSGGVPANADPTSGAGLHLQWTNTGNWYQAQLPSTLPNNVAIQTFESLYYNGQRRLRSRIHDNGTSGYPSIGYFMHNGQCVASPSTPAGQRAPTLASCNLGTFLRVANTISPSSTLGQGCPYASSVSNNLPVSKCLDRFVYTNTAGGDPIQAWQNLYGAYSGNPATPCVPGGNSYPAGDVELILFDAWTVDVMRVNCVDTADNVIFLLGPTKGGGTGASSDTNYNYFGPTVGHRYLIENTMDAFNDALTPTSSQYGIAGIWFLDRHTVPWVLNYIANPGENPNSDSIVIPQLGGSIPGAPATDYIGGSLIAANGLEYVTFQGITFEVDNFYPNSIGLNNDGNGEMALPQAIDCENCQFVTFNAVTVAHTSASGILAAATAATPACSGTNPPACVVIENSTLYDIGDSGIRVGHTVGNSDTSATVVQDVLAQNNLIQGYSRVFADGEGIAEMNGNNNQYSYNTIMDGYHAAISICNGGCGPTKNGASISGNNIISSYNLISNIIQGVTSDGGALYYNVGNGSSSGKGDSITSNVINNVTDSYIIDNPTTAGVAVMGSGYGGEGIQLDAGSANVQATNNVVYNVSDYAIKITDGLASSKETENIFNNNIFAFANLGMFTQQTPWSNGCPASPIEQVSVTNNIFYFDRSSTSTPSFYVIQGCRDSCKQAYDTYQNFQGNSYWRTDGGFANDSSAFKVLTTQGLNSNNSCKTSPTTSLYFASATKPSWQTGGTGVPVAMNEDLSPNATASYQPPFTGSGLITDLPANYLFGNGQIPPTQFAPSNTNLTIRNAHSSLSPVGTVPPTFPTYVYGSPINKF